LKTWQVPYFGMGAGKIEKTSAGVVHGPWAMNKEGRSKKTERMAATGITMPGGP
jgi:hypothetical protein